MNKINSLDRLLNALDKDLAWRKKEIIDLKIACENDPEKIFIQKSAILLIYSHWEGFIKNASKKYLEYLNNQEVLCKDMQINFIILHLGGVFQEDINYKNYLHRKKIYTQYTESLLCKFNVSVNETIKTNCNLNSNTFKTILGQLGISEDLFELKFKLIDEKLLGYRNALAHGEMRPVTSICAVVTEIKDVILEMLDNFYDQITTAAENKTYLKSKEKELI